VPICAVALLLGFALVPESRDPEPGAFDLPGALLSVGGLVTLVYAVIEAPSRGWTDPVVLGGFGLAAAFAAAFVRWELHTSSPLLDLSFFRNPRFSVASGAISLAFFSLFGAMFALTQFMQQAHGYTALEAGAAMVPLAAGLVIGSGSSIKLVKRRGTAPVVTAGLLGLAVLLGLSFTWSPDMAYLPLGLWFFCVAVCIGWIMGPATESVMGAVPEQKSGVASAMNDVTRQVAGALGTAVIGSLISTLYASRVGDATATLPEQARVAAEDSIGQANAVAAGLPAEEGARLAGAAADAFTEALAIGFTVAAAFAAVAAVIVKVWLPSQDAPRSEAPAERRQLEPQPA
jgi:Na+/melibiose symporter-like transporter